VTVDIGKPQGQQLVRRLAAASDVVIENYKSASWPSTGSTTRDWPRQPRLIYCSITGFGQDGPYKDRAGYDFIIQAMGGFMSITASATTCLAAGRRRPGWQSAT